MPSAAAIAAARALGGALGHEFEGKIRARDNRTPEYYSYSFLAEVLFLGEKMLSCEVRVKNPFGSEYAAKLIMRFCGQDCLEKPWN